MRPSWLCIPLACAVLVSTNVPAFAQAAGGAPPGQAEEELPTVKGHRRFLLAALGIAIGTLPALAVPGRSSDGSGFCSSRSCTMALGAAMGGSAGFLIGRDLDRSAALREARGPTLHLPLQTIELDLTPEAVDAYEGGAIVIGREGIATVGQDRTVRRRGGAIRGVSAAAALPAHDAVLAVTGTGVYSFDLTGSQEAGRMVLPEGGATLEPIAADQVVLAGSDLVRRLRLSGRGSLVRLAEESRGPGMGLSTALAYSPQAGILWSLAGDRLVAKTPEFREVGSVVLPAAGRSLSISGERAIVAAGPNGLFTVDIREPANPRLLGQLRGIGFAFDAVLQGDTAYIAAGREGLLVVDVADPGAPRVLGVTRGLGFVGSVALAPDGRLYATDREGERLFLLELQTSGSGPGGER
ncbi:MAG TPA: hypothetical protein VIL18_13220 [Longimicrobiales bacterium]